MQQDFGPLIYVALPSTRLRSSPGFFRSKYTVNFTQEYEIQFARIGCPVAQSVYRRYRQFHHMHRDLQAVEELQEVKFPERHVLNNLKAEIVSKRRLELEQWLRAIAGLQSCHSLLYEFLGLAGSQPLEPHSHSFGENFLTLTLHRLISEPHMKLATLEFFDKRFFPRAGSLHPDYIFVFLHFLLPLVSDSHAGSQALSVLHSLISRKKFKGAGDVIRTVPLLTKEDIKKARLETHLLERYFRGTRESACEVFKVVYEECISQGQELVLELVLSTQLNLNTEAFHVFETWYSTQLEETQSIQSAVNETPWGCKISPDGDVRVRFRAVGKVVESEISIIINANIDRIIQVILQPDLRCLWDLRVATCSVTPSETSSGFKVRIEVENGGVTHEIEGMMRMEREEERKAMIYFEATMEMLSTSYEIVSLGQRSDLSSGTSSCQSLPCISPTDSDQTFTPSFTPIIDQFDDQIREKCSVLVRNYGGETVAKLFVSDLLGEENIFLNTWMKFKSVAEGDMRQQQPENPSESFNSVLCRKTLPSFSAKTSEKETRDFSTRKLERRMFLS